jgi:hypothetical protein
MASLQAVTIQPVGDKYIPYSDDFTVDYIDERGTPFSHEIQCIGITYRERIIKEPHKFYREEMAPIGGAGMCPSCASRLCDIKKYDKHLESIWTTNI